MVAIGIVMMLVANLLFSVVDSSSKWLLAVGFPAMQLAFFRYSVHFAITLGDAARSGLDSFSLPRRHRLVVFVRAFSLVSATLVNFYALQFLPLSVMAAIMLSAPVIVCTLSGPMLGETVGPWRWTAIGIGFAGVLCVIRPFSEGFQWAALLMLYPATGLAVYAVLTRKLAGTISPMVMQLSVGVVGAIALTPFTLIYWKPPETTLQFLLLPLLGIAAWAGHECLTRAHKHADASLLTPYSYSYLVYMTLAGLLVFGEVPDALTLAGSALIVFSGLVIWLRERRHVG